MIKKILKAAMIAVMMFWVSGSLVNAASDIDINEKNFPDTYFRYYVLEKIDKDKNKRLSSAEISGVKDIIWTSNNPGPILNLKGLEIFTSLERLYMGFAGRGAESLDLSKNIALKELYCNDLGLKNLNVSGCSSLEVLNCNRNQIAKLDVTGCTKLIELSCRENSIKTLNLSKCHELEKLYCDNNCLTSVDITGCVELSNILCGNNSLKSLDVRECSNLRTMGCEKNQLTELDIRNNTQLLSLSCYGNKIKSLAIWNNPNLLHAYVDGTREDYEDTNSTLYHLYDSGFYDLYVDRSTVISTIVTTPNPTTTPKPTVTSTPMPTMTVTPRPTVEPTAKPTSRPIVSPSPAYVPTNTPVPTAGVSLTIPQSSIRIVCGQTTRVVAKLVGSDAKIFWVPSDKTIVEVDGKGVITAKKAGNAMITATAAGRSAKCRVTVLYKDVTNTKIFWFEPTYYLTFAGVVKGYNKQTEFRPANKCTRAQMVTFIWRLQGEPAPKTKMCKFKDVKKTDYFYKACLWGNENHIVEGYKDGTFGPKIVCARRHAVTFLWRLAGEPKPLSSGNKFKDVKKTDYYYRATLWASEKKVLTGYTDGTFRPNGDCLRRQMVTFLYKYDKYVKRKT